MKFLVALALVACALAQDDEPEPSMRVWVGMTSFNKGDRIMLTCGPCDDADTNNMVTMTMEKCSSQDSCTAFYKMVWEKGTEEAAPPPMPSPFVTHDIDLSYGLYASLDKDNGQCADAGMYKCQCGGSPFYGDVKINGC